MRARRGQNFLHDANIARKMTNHAVSLSPAGGECDEIGAGRGALTERLLEGGFTVTAIELDESLATILAQKFLTEKLRVVRTDIRDWQPQGGAEKRLCIGNIPYYITTEIFAWFKTNRACYHHGMFMVQEEVAQRVVASPATRSYGRLTVFLRLFFEVEKLFSVSRNCFYPVPEVDSAVISLTPRPAALLSSEREQEFAKFTHLLFHTRRKTLGKICKLHNLPSLPCDLRQRPEDLSPEEIFRWFCVYSEGGNPSNRNCPCGSRDAVLRM